MNARTKITPKYFTSLWPTKYYDNDIVLAAGCELKTIFFKTCEMFQPHNRLNSSLHIFPHPLKTKTA